MASSNEFRIAVIGAGNMGRDHINVLRTRVSNCTVAAVVDIDLDRAKTASAPYPDALIATNAEEAFDRVEVDGVLIVTPGPFHAVGLEFGLDRDLAIFCEKPLTPDATSAEAIVRAEAQQGRRRIQVGFMRRYEADYRQLRVLVDSGELGQLLMLHCAHRAPAVADTFTADMLVSDSVVHEFDITRYLAKGEITTVQVRQGRGSHHSPYNDPQQVLLTTSTGVLVDVEIFVNAQYGYEVTTEAVFEEGIVNLGHDHGPPKRQGGRTVSAIPTTYVGRFEDAYAAELQVWVDASRSGTVAGPSTWDGYAAAACCEAGIRSQSTGEIEPVALVDRPSIYDANERQATVA